MICHMWFVCSLFLPPFIRSSSPTCSSRWVFLHTAFCAKLLLCGGVDYQIDCWVLTTFTFPCLRLTLKTPDKHYFIKNLSKWGLKQQIILWQTLVCHLLTCQRNWQSFDKLIPQICHFWHPFRHIFINLIL